MCPFSFTLTHDDQLLVDALCIGLRRRIAIAEICAESTVSANSSLSGSSISPQYRIGTGFTNHQPSRAHARNQVTIDYMKGCRYLFEGRMVTIHFRV